MNTIFTATKIVVLLGLGVLIGQLIYITHNTSIYLQRGQVQLEVPSQAQNKPQPIVEVVEVERVINDWTDVPARKTENNENNI